MSSCYKAKLSENHYKYSSINMNFIRVVTWLKVAGLWRKGYKDSKYICGLEKFNQDHQGLMSFPSSCSFFFFSFFYFFIFSSILFFFFSFSKVLDVEPSFLIILLDELRAFDSSFFDEFHPWDPLTKFRHVDDPCLGYFFERKNYFWFKEGAKDV